MNRKLYPLIAIVLFFSEKLSVYALGNLDINLNTSDGSSLDTIGILVLMTILSFLPSILMTMTSFTRFIIVFSFLRSGMGTQNTPPNQVLIGLALMLSIFVFYPTFEMIKGEAYEPYKEEQIDSSEAMVIASGHMKDFMMHYTRENDLSLFVDIAEKNVGIKYENIEEIPMYIVVPSYIISELKTAFEIGFLIFIPFIVIDIVIASILMSMGMFMMPPTMIALPFKILLFVLVDGWHLIIESMITGMV